MTYSYVCLEVLLNWIVVIRNRPMCKNIEINLNQFQTNLETASQCQTLLNSSKQLYKVLNTLK